VVSDQQPVTNIQKPATRHNSSRLKAESQKGFHPYFTLNLLNPATSSHPNIEHRDTSN
jgi:hypothetical protein